MLTAAAGSEQKGEVFKSSSCGSCRILSISYLGCDMMTLLFDSNLGDIFYNTGHGHLGWTLSAETAEILAKKILNET